ncbi:ExeM/NucH family extracellular endonuclease [Lampropedia aestuarii]|uniref:ExeM/NucH family extracellular endonuclease n=1 Tax=Lampropedia aestuarii TaxID=2562762 RepID=UPI002468BDE1|nr:ExeM/NucH family extracellular endonuclease [Lampropedia aestuarii]MDH5856580.1 ExeM/NucH family extracellular endonuclease [Lampropedia aestuarii]
MSFEFSSLQTTRASFAQRSALKSRGAISAPSYRAVALAAALCMAGVSHAAPSAIAPGQLGLVSVNSTDPDPISFVLMCNAKVGTTIHFTDNGWTSTGVFRSGEGVATWTAARDVAAGEVITLRAGNTGSPAVEPADAGTVTAPKTFNVAGSDSVLVYQGTLEQPAFIFGLNHVPSGAWDADASSSNTSSLPAALTNGQSAVALQQRSGQHAQDYTGALRTGTAAELVAAIADKNNWASRPGGDPSLAATALTVTNAADCAEEEQTTQPNDPDTITRISAIQGTGAASPMDGSTVKVSAVVTAFVPGIGGFALQEADADRDGNPATSEGIFVYYGNTPPQGVSADLVGKRVTFNAKVSEYRGQTQLSGIAQLVIGEPEALPTPETITLPVASSDVWEQREGMVVQVCGADAQPLVVTDSYELGRYGNIVLSAGQRQVQFTEHSAPNLENNKAYLQQVKLSRIILDDGISAQNPAEHLGRNGALLSASNTLRGGDQTSCITGLLDQFTDKNKAVHEIDYRIQPTQTAMFTGAQRPTAAALQQAVQGSNLKVASVNVLNFFVTLDPATFTVPGTSTSHEGRGAEARISISEQAFTDEYQRQLDKLVEQLLALDADIYGLNEIQNDGFAANGSLATLVAALNAKAGAGTYAYAGANGLTDGARTLQALGTDAITVAIIYNTQRVAPQGQAVAPDVRQSQYSAFTAAHGNRVPVAQTFQVLALEQDDPDALVTVAVNHFKSKGSVINGETDQGDGQGANNPSRMVAAQQLSAWLATNPTGFEQAHTVLTGDFNSYSKEDPIRILESAGYQLQKQDGDVYSYSFDGLWGSLDHIFTSASLAEKIGGVVEWSVNAEEPTVLDYNYNYKTLEQTTSYYSADYYRASDHNPILVGLKLGRGGVGPVEPEPIADFEFDVPGASNGAVLSGSLAGGGGSCVPAEGGAPAAAMPSTWPANVQFPYQLLAWELEGCATGSSVTVTLNLPEPVPANAKYWKYGPTTDNETAHWYTIPFTQTGEQQIQFTIQDGGLGDSDLKANGRIVDPGGLGVPAAVVPPTGSLTPVPVDSPWMLGALGAVLAGIGAARARRRTRN